MNAGAGSIAGRANTDDSVRVSSMLVTGFGEQKLNGPVRSLRSIKKLTAATKSSICSQGNHCWPLPSRPPANRLKAETMVANDPKVVIEPATPAASAAEPAGGAATDSAVKEDDQGDQPKRRGWWNRFI